MKIPERAEYLRVIFAELARIASHLVWVATHALDIGAMTVFLYAFRERELILDMFEIATGQRMTSSWIRVGGIREDVPALFFEKLRSLFRYSMKGLIPMKSFLPKTGFGLREP